MHDTQPQGVQSAQGASPYGVSLHVQLIHVDQVFVPSGRQRRDPGDAKPLADLKRGIVSKGLLHPPVLAHRIEPVEGEPHLQLIAGERRLLAVRELHADGLGFLFNGTPVPPGFIPYTLLGELSPADYLEAELEENVLRVQLRWDEESKAKLAIHELRKAQNPKQTLAATAQEIVDKKGPAAEVSVSTETKNITMAQTVAPYLELPSVKGAKSLKKAYAIVLDQQHAKLARDLRRLGAKSSPHTIIRGDFVEVSKTLAPGSFDLILSDPPYGIDIHQHAFEKRHAYDDSKDYALRLYREILRKGFHLLKPQGTVFLFCDIEHFITIRTFAEQQAFSTWRTPIIWQKGIEGPAPWGKNGFTRTYEVLLFAVKGQRPLSLGPEPDIKLVRRAGHKDDRRHAAEKPPELIRWLLELSTYPGCRVLDPCAGSGPILPAARDLGLELTLIEQEEDYHAALCLRAQEVEQGGEPEVASLVQFPQTIEDLDDEIFGTGAA